MSRRFLVVVRAGDQSLHPQWLDSAPADPAGRNWDLVVNYYGDDPQRYAEPRDGVVRVDSKGAKWPALYKLLGETREVWRGYDYIWLPDDDLAADCATINRMFELMAGLELHLGQPSLSWNSFISLVMTSHNPAFALRYSSFVEPMAPCFSRAHLERVLPTFGEVISGWGLDYVWPQMLDSPATQCAILDRVQVRHTRPVGGPNYKFSREAGVEPRDEMAQLLKRHGIPSALQLSYGGMDSEGRRYSLFGDQGPEFIYRLAEGYVPFLGDKPNLLGTVFAWHVQARAEAMRASKPAAPQAATPGTRPAGAPPMTALQRFQALAAAAAVAA